ncbi:DUF2937 family protein [Amphritea opalescens]|uniref:DUF2937 family protein n=1 Tax=Amphritea opalescens TaxID=2490544 RepID=A0A430KRT8_9GAMM|nr:DUF2937 family protein [Amphritea opalescens]RTE66217.1 DUF2937 family protein [Amphritea opalescens]
MIGRLIDKFIFGLTLLFALQVPQLADQYQQFLSGLYQATRWQVEGYQQTAQAFGYTDAHAMIQHHRQNSVASVRADAEQKLATLAQNQQLQQGVTLFETASLIRKALYMANPTRYRYLETTLHHFSPGIPLTIEGIAFGVIVGLLLNLIITLPMSFFFRRIGLMFKPTKPNSTSIALTGLDH